MDPGVWALDQAHRQDILLHEIEQLKLCELQIPSALRRRKPSYEQIQEGWCAGFGLGTCARRSGKSAGRTPLRQTSQAVVARRQKNMESAARDKASRSTSRSSSRPAALSASSSSASSTSYEYERQVAPTSGVEDDEPLTTPAPEPSDTESTEAEVEDSRPKANTVTRVPSAKPAPAAPPAGERASWLSSNNAGKRLTFASPLPTYHGRKAWTGPPGRGKKYPPVQMLRPRIRIPKILLTTKNDGTPGSSKQHLFNLMSQRYGVSLVGNDLITGSASGRLPKEKKKKKVVNLPLTEEQQLVYQDIVEQQYEEWYEKKAKSKRRVKVETVSRQEDSEEERTQKITDTILSAFPDKSRAPAWLLKDLEQYHAIRRRRQQEDEPFHWPEEEKKQETIDPEYQRMLMDHLSKPNLPRPPLRPHSYQVFDPKRVDSIRNRREETAGKQKAFLKRYHGEVSYTSSGSSDLQDSAEKADEVSQKPDASHGDQQTQLPPVAKSTSRSARPERPATFRRFNPSDYRVTTGTWRANRPMRALTGDDVYREKLKAEVIFAKRREERAHSDHAQHLADKEAQAKVMYKSMMQGVDKALWLEKYRDDKPATEKKPPAQQSTKRKAKPRGGGNLK